MQNPCQKENAIFRQKSQGEKIRTKYIYKIVCENTFSYAIQNTKGPAEAEPEIFSAKRRRLLGGLPRSRSSLAMTFFSLTAPQGERSDRACTGIAEPKGSYTVGVESTVCRGVLSALRQAQGPFACCNGLKDSAKTQTAMEWIAALA